MTAIQIIFYVFSFIAIASGMMVVASTNPVRGVLFLVLTFFAMAGIWLLLQAEFLALILVLVYVGAVMTLFLFVVMMLPIHVVSAREGFVRYWPLVLLIVLLMMALSIMVIGPEHFGLDSMPAPPFKSADYSNTHGLGMLLYTEYALPFEISGVMLLTAIIAAISLSHRKPKDRKVQRPSEQVRVQRKDRIRLMQVPSEKKIKPTGIGQ